MKDSQPQDENQPQATILKVCYRSSAALRVLFADRFASA